MLVNRRFLLGLYQKITISLRKNSLNVVAKSLDALTNVAHALKIKKNVLIVGVTQIVKISEFFNTIFDLYDSV